MRSILRNPALAACTLLLAVAARTASADATAPEPTRPVGPAVAGPVNIDARVSADATANAQAEAESARLRENIEKKAKKVSAQARANADRRLEAAVRKLDESAVESGDAMVSRRIAAELGLVARALAQERAELEASWGELLIAYVLAANSSTRVTAAQLVRWHHDGQPWSRLAAGLGLSLNSVVSSVDAEARVAVGMARADGRVAAIYGEGARINGAGLDFGAGARRLNRTGTTSGLGIKLDR